MCQTLVSSSPPNFCVLLISSLNSFPSWGYMYTNAIEPATTNVWELWDAPTKGPGYRLTSVLASMNLLIHALSVLWPSHSFPTA